jgi:hypothetical protein
MAASKRLHKSGSQKQNNIVFYNPVRKYGWNNFEWEILYQSKEREHTLNIMEPCFHKRIQYFSKWLQYDNWW